MQLREYQIASIHNLREAFRSGHRRVLLQAATGAGKTVIASAMIQSAVSRGKSVLFIAHRKEIISQTSAKLDIFGVDHGVIMSGHPRYRPRDKVQVASIQTLSRRHKPDADLIIIDECHLSCAKSFVDLLSAYPEAKVIGLTATPTRLDGVGMGSIYTHIVEVAPVRHLIDNGHLVNARVYAPFIPNMHGVRTVAGDFDQHAVAELMDKNSITGDIIEHWKKYAAGRKTIVFAASVAHSEHICAAFVESGISARHLNAKTPAKIRDGTLDEWRKGKFDVLSNCGLFIEGLDVPEIDCVILARPTQSITIYLQSVGRGMRTARGKRDVIVLDHAGLTYRHGLIDEPRVWALEGSKKKKKAADSDQQSVSVVICESCFAAFSRALHPDHCPECGTPLPKRSTQVADVRGDGELIELTAEYIAAIKARKKDELKAARTIDDLILLGISRGYKHPRKWAEHIMNGRKAWRYSRGGIGYGG